MNARTMRQENGKQAAQLEGGGNSKTLKEISEQSNASTLAGGKQQGEQKILWGREEDHDLHNPKGRNRQRKTEEEEYMILAVPLLFLPR